MRRWQLLRRLAAAGAADGRQAAAGRWAPRSLPADAARPAARAGPPGPRGATRQASSSAQSQHAAAGSIPAPAARSSWDWRYVGILGGSVMGAVAVWDFKALQAAARGAPAEEQQQEQQHHLVNWSGTHEVRPRRLEQPESLAELERAVAAAHQTGSKLRCVGSALSPNGLGFCEEGMVSLALMDKVLEVDPATRQVRVQAGARVQEVVEALRPHGLTLQNYASIREQAIGGFIQVGAHGTGATLPPVDEQVVGLTLVTPGQGTLQLSAAQQPELFWLARCGLGALGVVAEVVLQAVPAHQLLEHTLTVTRQEVRRKHARWLREHRHLRYMWYPYTDKVVVVTNNPVKTGQDPPRMPAPASLAERTAPLRRLLAERQPPASPQAAAEAEALSATQLRDALLALAPLDADWVARINQAEVEYWRRSEGHRVGWSDELLGFDCGGEQWVNEVAFPTGTLRSPSGADLAYMDQLLRLVEGAHLPAPAPIEQRWSAASRSPMSPASAPRGAADTLTSWVGIIMYLPTEDPAQRQAITQRFREYVRLVEREVMPRVGATEHWAKVEVEGRSPAELAALRARLAARFPVAEFNQARRRLDPKNIMANELIDTLFPLGA